MRTDLLPKWSGPLGVIPRGPLVRPCKRFLADIPVALRSRLGKPFYLSHGNAWRKAKSTPIESLAVRMNNLQDERRNGGQIDGHGGSGTAKNPRPGVGFPGP
jgi:hypothetical protein